MKINLRLIFQLSAASVIIFAALLFIGGLVTIPLSWYFKGCAHQQWLKEKHGIEMPWYRAAEMPISGNDLTVEVRK